MITIYLSGNKFTSTSPGAFSLYEKSRFGEKHKGKIEYSPIEAIYLLEKKKAEIIQGKKSLDLEETLKKTKRIDKRITTKLPVYENMRKKGYILKTALKFGADFRAYKKGSKPGKDHALWILFCVKENESHSWHEFAAKSRVAHSTRKKLLLGIVDDEESVTYYEVGWLKP